MTGRKVRGTLLDVDYVNREGKSIIRLFVRTGKGIEIFEDLSFQPYFYVTAQNAESLETELRESNFGKGTGNVKASREEKANKGEVLRIEFGSVEGLKAGREKVKEANGVLELHEHDVPFAKRWLLDHEVQPMGEITLQAKGKKIESLEKGEGEKKGFRMGAFDLETISPERFSDPEKDAILMASFVWGSESKVFSYGKKFNSGWVERHAGEKEMLKAFVKEFKESSLDIAVTYNGDLFDFPYLKSRCSLLGISLGLGADGSTPKVQRKGRDNAVKMKGVQHLDAYKMLRFLSRFGVVSLVKYDLESVVSALFGKEKEKISAEEINKIWEKGKEVDRLAAYCKADSESTLRISEQYLPLLVELCKLVKQTLYEVSRSSASMLVEYLLMNKCRKAGTLIANKPREDEVRQRLLQTYKGGFVKEPQAGLHENIAVLDFSSLHPTIMISHNVSPDTLNCSHASCKKENSAPNKQWFCKKKEGLLSSILQELFQRRMKIKKELKQGNKGKREAVLLDARQHALKIILNSFYGYLGYPRSRFYSRECASAVTAWSRKYVKWVAEKAEAKGFKVLYSDTDSAFLVIPKEKEREQVRRFVQKINQKLPGVMNLELEAFYKRGIFVTKETGEGAKKKYALIDDQNNLKIVGFEYVRRDWAKVAKDTQRQVIAAILEEGKPEKAIKIIKKTVEELRGGKVPKQDLVVLTQLKRPLEKYESVGPHVAAAKKAAAKGKEVGEGSVIGYIVTRSGKSISDRAQLEEYVKEGNYDPNYYIQNQVLPAVMKIIREFNISKEDLLQGGKQSSLGAFA